MDIGALIIKVFGDPLTATAAYGIVLLAVLDFATGSLRAIADKTFAWAAFDVWVRAKVAGRVAPILLVFVFGAAAPDLSVLGLQVNVLALGGFAAAATFGASELASVLDNLNRGATNPVPSDNLRK